SRLAPSSYGIGRRMRARYLRGSGGMERSLQRSGCPVLELGQALQRVLGGARQGELVAVDLHRLVGKRDQLAADTEEATDRQDQIGHLAVRNDQVVDLADRFAAVVDHGLADDLAGAVAGGDLDDVDLEHVQRLRRVLRERRAGASREGRNSGEKRQGMAALHVLLRQWVKDNAADRLVVARLDLHDLAQLEGRARRILADAQLGVLDEAVRWHRQVVRRRHTLEDAAGQVVARAVAGTEEAARPVGAEVAARVNAQLRDAAEMGADADDDQIVGLERTVPV